MDTYKQFWVAEVKEKIASHSGLGRKGQSDFLACSEPKLYVTCYVLG